MLVCAAGPTALERRLRPLTRREYIATIRDLLGVETTAPLAEFPAEIRIEGYDNMPAAAEVTARHIDAWMAEAELLATRALAEHRAELLPCIPGTNVRICAEEFIREFGARAWRRPLAGSEVDTLVVVFPSDPALFDLGMHDAIWSLLMSPHFLYRSELGVADGTGAYALDGFETASALSYLLIGSMPDDELFAAASEGRLATASGRRAEAERLLADPRAREQLGIFAAQWLGADPLLAGEKNATAFPEFSSAIQQRQFEELERFIAHTVLDTAGTFTDLLESSIVFADPLLAAYYGLPLPAGDQFQPIPVTDGSRGGILTLGSVLSAHAHSTDSSPIRRGVFVRRRLLCQALPPPPPDVDNTPPGLDPSLSTRERFATHSADASCQGCHRFIDGVGFGFLHFDGAGAYQANESGAPVDDSGALLGLESLGDQELIPFAGTAGLSSLLAGSENAARCLATQAWRWSRGQVEDNTLGCEIEVLGDAFIASGGEIRELLLRLIELPSFSRRIDSSEVNS
jgi:hypothetical protein